jgi:polar amino acid transport system substrate-binding protein
VFTLDDLEGKTIGVQLGTTGDIYATDVKDATIERYSKGVDAIQSLISGKVDCVIIDAQPAKAFVEKNSGKLDILSEPFALEEYAICVSKDNKALTDDINKALAELKANGTMDKIIANYIGDKKGTCPYEKDANNTGANGTLIMATNAFFEPYEYYEDGKVVGIDAEMAQAVADVLGKSLMIEDMEFDSIIAAVQTGKADIGVAGMTVTEERLQNIDFTDSYTTSTQVIVVRK